MRKVLRHGRARAILLFAGIAIGVAGVPAYPQTAPCDRYSIRDLRLGSTLGAVRARLGREGVTTNVTRTGEAEASAVEYQDGDASVYIEYDHQIGKKPEARVALLRGSLPSGSEALAALAERWGPPSAGLDELAAGLRGGPAVWIVERCDLVVSAYRRQGSWWSGDVGTFVQLERLEAARKGGSPATPALVAMAAQPVPDPASAGDVPPPAGGPPAPERSTASVPPDRLPERIEYVPPAYPLNLKRMGVRGRVVMSLSVRDDGTVADARVVDAEPPSRGFEAAALEAAKRWRYNPALRDGLPIPAEIQVVIEFK